MAELEAGGVLPACCPALSPVGLGKGNGNGQAVPGAMGRVLVLRQHREGADASGGNTPNQP